MERLERIFILHRMLSGRRVPVPRQEIELALECSRATVTRTIATMRDWLGAPIVYDSEQNGYRYDDGPDAINWELPGLWFKSSELQTLLLISEILEGFSAGLLSKELSPLKSRLDAMLRSRQADAHALKPKLRFVTGRRRPVTPETFATATEALRTGRQLRTQERCLSPQQLVFYRRNWYLAAWCHHEKAIDLLPLEQLTDIEILDREAVQRPEEELDCFEVAYGLCRDGEPVHDAVLRFSAPVAQRIAVEIWHPRQSGRWNGDGSYELTLPYSDPSELLRDLLSHGPDVEVLSPAALRDELAARIEQASELYAGDTR